MTSGRTDTKEYRKARLAALARDEHQCAKCGSSETLHTHHIIAHDAGGADDVDNLLTLCRRCHREWELFAVGNMDMDEWLELLPLARILNLIHHAELWRDDVPASAMRKLMSSDTSDMSEATANIVNANGK